MARSVSGCAASMSALAGLARRGPRRGARRPRLDGSPPTRSSAPGWRSRGAPPGRRARRLPLPGDMNPAFQVEAAKVHRELLHPELFAQHADLYGENVRRKLEAAFAVGGGTRMTALARRARDLPRPRPGGARGLRRPAYADDADGRPADRGGRPGAARADDLAHAAVNSHWAGPPWPFPAGRPRTGSRRQCRSPPARARTARVLAVGEAIE